MDQTDNVYFKSGMQVYVKQDGIPTVAKAVIISNRLAPDGTLYHQIISAHLGEPIRMEVPDCWLWSFNPLERQGA